MSRDEINESAPPLLIAALVCLLCLPAIYLATRPVVWLVNGVWVAWTLAAIFTVVPLAVTFLFLYGCAWRQELPRFRRMISALVSACIIFGVDLLLVAALVAIGCLIMGLSRVMGGN